MKSSGEFKGGMETKDESLMFSAALDSLGSLGLFVSTLSLVCLQKSPVLCIGEEQPKNWFTELQVLKGHFDIVRFLVQIDDFR